MQRFIQLISAWFVHLLTASTVVAGLLALQAVYQHDYILAFWWMGLAIFIDAIDGTLARLVHVKTVCPQIDGALLDNMADFLTYVITPCFMLLVHPTLLPAGWAFSVVCLMAITSAYQFTQSDAKTADHFFKGFPCYWNFVVLYLFIFETSALFNALTLTVCSILIFVPIKYVYPSRLDNVSSFAWLRRLTGILTISYGLACVLLLWTYPSKPLGLLIFSVFYICFYLAMSFYRTWKPLHAS